MNVLISSPVHWWNAEAAYAAVLAETLRDAGHRVWVLTQPDTRNHAELARRGLPLVTDFPLWSNKPHHVLPAIGGLRRFCARERIDVVNVFRSREFPWHLLAARGRGGAALVRTRGGARAVRGHWLNRWLYRNRCDGLITPSEAVRQPLMAALGLDPGRVRTIYYPTDLPPQGDAEARAAGRRDFMAAQGLAPDTVLLAIVGRVYPEKGHLVLQQALHRLAGEHSALPPFALLVLAKDVDDPAEFVFWLKEKERTLGLGQWVRWLGHREDLRRLMGWVDIGVVPSLASEVNCRVTVEFFSAGTPVVAFPTGALPEVVEHGRTGLVTRSHEAGELADTLAALIADPHQVRTMGGEARRAAETRFSLDRFLAETLAVYQAALAHRR